MSLTFTKMHGLGNDFVVIDAVSEPVELSVAQIRHLADRRFGVGCDQVLLAAPATKTGCDFRYRIFNADGSEVEQCGNGVRCLARFLHAKKLSTRKDMRIQTLGGDTLVRLREDGSVRVNMGVPVLEPADIPFNADSQAASYSLQVGAQVLDIGAVSMGNPHAVLDVPDVHEADVQQLGAAIEQHNRFPNRVNVGFMQVDAPDHIQLRVFERGVGETLACGTGACGAVAVGRIQGKLGERVAVDLPGGRLVIEWPGPGEPLYMTGPATFVFEGTIEL